MKFMFQVSTMYSRCSPAGFYQDGSPSVFLTVHQAKNTQNLLSTWSTFVPSMWRESGRQALCTKRNLPQFVQVLLFLNTKTTLVFFKCSKTTWNYTKGFVIGVWPFFVAFWRSGEFSSRHFNNNFRRVVGSCGPQCPTLRKFWTSAVELQKAYPELRCLI